MTAYNTKDFISEAIESVLNQSFTDFEFIIVNDGSIDSTRSKICSYNDKRIHLIDNDHDYIHALNTGLKAATGKYLARMDADDICHIDRFKIQHAIMEAFPEITVCCSWVNFFGKKVPSMTCRQNSGIVEYPLVQLLPADFIFNPSTLTRTSFLKEHNLLYEEYTYAEDYKFWVEAAKLGAVFYLESQPLVYKRVDDSQVTIKHRGIQIQTSTKIKREILDFLCNKNENRPALQAVSNAFCELFEDQLISEDDMIKILYTLFMKNKDKLTML